jgi:hypothetical protein
VFTNGDYEIRTDTKLVDEYGFKDDHDGDDGTKESSVAKVAAPAIITGTRIDHRPMGRTS